MDLLCWEQFLLSCSLDGTIRVWAANAAGQLETTFTHPEDEGQAEPRNGALKMCGCNDGAGKPVLLVSYNDNIVRLYDLPTYEFQHTILKLVLKTLFLGGRWGKLPKY
jgi:WD40 repeat protein